VVCTGNIFLVAITRTTQHLIGRRGQIKSGNFAGFAALHNYASGKRDHNLWGPAIMPFETTSGTPYHFNFHREIEGMVAGHTAFTADTGAGKTTLLAALIAMADKVSPRVFWFDNREGAKVFMCAMGARHTTLTVQGSTHWNPFKLPETQENKAYLLELLTLMRTCYGGSVTPDDIARLKSAVEENYALPEKDRRLRNIAWCFGQGILADDMRIWHGANGHLGANAGVFDNLDDVIDLRSCRHYCFEMRQLIKDGIARPELAVMLSYPFHCIEQSMNGEPFILVLEEGQNLVRHDYWKQKIDSYIMQIRRKNGVLIFVTPDPKYLYCETDAIQKQTVTKIFLPNSEARYEDYVGALGLTENEFEFIRDTPCESRAFLIRRGQESVKAIFDLSTMTEFIAVLSSNDKSVALMEAIQAELETDEPAQWVPVFMRRALKNNTHNLAERPAS
jgi:type IV secretion system protein VirB4